MPTVQELINAGFGGYAGWDDDEANANYNATGGVGKETSGSSSGETGTQLPALDFNWDAAKAKALQELTPYYTKLLDMYKGDIALAKQHMDKDYERGLRVQTEKTETGLQDIAATQAERKRKFDIALKDLDQTANSRGLTTSGIKTEDINKATADEAYQKGLLANQARDLTTGLQYYKEGLGATRDSQLEKWGMKPVSAAPSGEFAPSNEGLNTTGYNVNSYVSEPLQKVATLDYQKEMDAQTKAQNAYNDAFTLWQTQVNQLNS